MALRYKIIIFILAAAFCLAAQSYDAYMGVNPPANTADNID